jgi:hypothetical protein
MPNHRGGGRGFFAPAREILRLIPANRTKRHPLRISPAAPNQFSFPPPIPELTRLLGKKNGMTRLDLKPIHFFLSSSGGI